MPGLQKPTGKSVRDLHHKLELDWDPRIRLDEEFRDLVHQRNPIEVLELSDDRNIDTMEFHSGRAGGIIEHAGGLLMARPAMHAEPPTLNTEDTRTAEQVERASANLFEQELIANNFWQSVGRDILIYGRAFIKSMLSASQWTAEAGYPVRESKETDKDYLTRIRKWKETEGKFPFVIQHIPALGVLPLLDSSDNVLATIEVKWATAKVLADDFGSQTVKDMLSRRTLKWYEELPVIEYIDNEWVSYLLAGTEIRRRDTPETNRLYRGVKSYQPLRTWRHNLGKHPIVMIPGIRTELTDYKSHFKGFLSDAKDALVMYDFLLSRLATMINAYYLPSYEWKLGASSAQFAGRDRPILNVNLGGVTVTYADENLDTLAIPQGLPDATMLLAQSDDIIQRHCAAASDKIRLADGSITTYGKLVERGEKVKVSTPDGSRLAYAFPASVEPLYEVVLESGQKFRVTMHHKFSLGGRSWANGHIGPNLGDPYNWITADAIKQKDYVLALNKQEIDEDERLSWINPNLSLLLGLILSDGWVDKRGRAVFRNQSLEILDIFERAALEIKQPIGRGKDTIRVNIGLGRGGNDRKEKPITKDDTPLLWASQWLGLQGKKAGDKKLPVFMNRLPLKSAAAMLRGLLLGDGSIINYGGLTFGCYSENLRDWVALTARRLGCPGRSSESIGSDGKTIYHWFAFSEFVDELVNSIGGLQGKNNIKRLFQPHERRTKRQIDEKFHRQKVVQTRILPPEPTVCLTVLEGDSHVYSDDCVIFHNTLEDVLFGRVQGAAPAYQVNLRINVAKSKLSPLAQNMAVGVTNVLDLFLRGIIQLGEAVIIGGEKITVAMAKQYLGRLTVSITPKSPVDRSHDIGTANLALQFGLPWEWIVENILDIEDPATLLLMKDIRELEELPPVKERLMKDALEHLEALIEEDEFDELGGVDLASLPPEFADAARQLLGGGGEAGAGGATLPPLGVKGAPKGGLGRGPGPPGSHPSTLIPRGLGVPNRQPEPGGVLVGEEV